MEERWAVPPLVIDALKLVWKQHDELKELKRDHKAKAVAEVLSERECTCTVWEVYDEMTGVLLMDFPTEKSMEPFLPRLRYQHGELRIEKRTLGRPTKH